MSRIAPPDLETLSPEKRETVGERALLNITRVALLAPDALWRAHYAFKLACVFDTTMDAGLREVLILRVAQLSRCEYELHHHRSISANLGFSPEKQAAILLGRYETLTPEERAVAEFTDDVVVNVRPSDATLQPVRTLFGDPLVIEMLILIGSYMATARMAEATGVAPDAEPVRSWTQRDKAPED